jgi:hypothetical protein
MDNLNSYTIVVYDKFGNFTKTKEESNLNINEYIKCKKEEGYEYNIIIGYIILLTKYNIDVKISDALDEDDINSETWKYEKKFFGNYWKT